jgi:hypothetical protein
VNAKLNFQIIFLLESISYANVNVPDNILQDNLQQKEISINNVVSTVNNEGTDVVEQNKENETFFNKGSFFFT